jgi:hypothetical protein
MSNNETKFYATIAIETFIAFYLASFCLAMFFIHHGRDWMLTSIFMGLLYTFVIFVCGKRLISQLNAPALMIIVPIAPLLVLIIMVSLIPLIQLLHY